ncbi:MAG: hypothetical protein WCW33_03945 [Candidatus Babeliales bacterium]|jgi:hypothetical protein
MLKRNIVYTIALAVALPCVGVTNIAAQHPHAARAIRGQAFRFALHKEFKDLNHQLEDVKGRKTISGLMGLAGFNPDVQGSDKDHEIFIEGGAIHFVTLRGNVENAVRKVATQCGSFTHDERRQALQALRESITKIGACIFSKFHDDGKALDTFDVRHPDSPRTVQSYNALLSIIDQAIAQLDAQPLAAQPRVEIKEAPVQQVVRRPAAVQSQKPPVISAPIKVIPAKDVVTTSPKAPAIVAPKTPALQQQQPQPQAQPVVIQATAAAPTTSATSSTPNATAEFLDHLLPSTHTDASLGTFEEAMAEVMAKVRAEDEIERLEQQVFSVSAPSVSAPNEEPELSLPERQPAVSPIATAKAEEIERLEQQVFSVSIPNVVLQDLSRPDKQPTAAAKLEEPIPAIAAPKTPAEVITTPIIDTDECNALAIEELACQLAIAEHDLQEKPFEDIRNTYTQEAEVPAASDAQLALARTPEEHVKDFLIPTGDNFGASFKKKLLAGDYTRTKDKQHDELLAAFAHGIAQLMQEPNKTTLAANLQKLISGEKFITDKQRYRAEIERLIETNDAAIIAKITENNPQNVVSELLDPYIMMLMLPQPADGTVIKNLGDYIAWYLQYQHQTEFAGCKQEHVDFLIELLRHSGCKKEVVEKIEGSIKAYCSKARRFMERTKSIARSMKKWLFSGSNVAANTALSCMVNKYFGCGFFANFILADFIRGCLPYKLTVGEVIASILLAHWTHEYLP